LVAIWSDPDQMVLPQRNATWARLKRETTGAGDRVPWSGVTLARDFGDGCRSPRWTGHRV